jgi:F-type H+-transporting ATPase subunit gamma
MANLKEIRSRIVSVNSTKQITAAMKMVSAAKLKRAQDAVTQMRPYAQKLQGILSNLSTGLDSDEGVYSAEREVNKVLLILVASNRGLCGGFNNQVLKQAKVLMDQYEGKNVRILALSKKAFDKYKKLDVMDPDIFGDTPYTLLDDLKFEEVAEVAENIMKQYREGTYDKVVLVYNSFKNAAVHLCLTEQYLPIAPPETAEDEKAQAIDYIFEPGKEEIVSALVPQSLKIQLFKALLDSAAAEHGARMTAMHKATDNATELSKELKLTYNKARQAAITAEILEIVGGAEALKN